MSILKKLIKYIIPEPLIYYLRYDIFDGWALKSYAQEGEDMILRRLFESKTTGFYVDVGAHHPKRFSNTYFFYKQGWKGINIDAMPGSMDDFNIYRPRDVNIEASVSSETKQMPYYIFNEPALNGFDPVLSKIRDSRLSQYKIIKTINIKTRRLEDILDDYLPSGQIIDFMSIDVEGLDFEVLKSNNWSKYKPEVVLVEVIGSTLADLLNNQVTQYLSKYDYDIYAKSVNTVIYKNIALK
jgi:FkbM family methyltransferase